MKRLLSACSFAALFVLLMHGPAVSATALSVVTTVPTGYGVDPTAPAPVVTGMSIPRSFVLNQGQWDARVRAASFGPGSTVSVGREGYRIAVRNGMAAREAEAFATPYPGMRLVGVSDACIVQGREVQDTKLRYLRGEGTRAITRMLDRHRVLRFAGAWKGIDVDVTGTGATMRHTVRVAAGTDPSRVALRFDHVTKEHLAASVQGSDAGRLRLDERDGGVDVSIGGGPAVAAFTVTVVYNYYWGGSGNDWGGASRVDRAGDLHVTGVTLSANFPLVPGGTPPNASTSATFVAVLSGDGKSVRYSTVFDQAALSWVNDMHHLVIGKHDRTILHLYANNVAPLLTPDAQFHPRWTAGSAMLVLDNAGAIVYATATPDSGRVPFVDMETGSDGAIYAVTTVNGTNPTINPLPDFLTPDAYQSTWQGGSDGVIMKFDADTYQLIYASIFGGPGADNLNSITVDGCGSVAVSGTNSGGGYPLVNAAQERNAGGMDLVFTRFSQDFQRIIYSTYLGGSYSEEEWAYGYGYGWDAERRLRFDPDGNLYFAGVTASPDFPVIRPVQAQTGLNTDIVLGKFSPTGELLFSSFFGGSHHEYSSGLDVDACGNMILFGTSASRDLPLVQPMIDSGFAFLAVIDTRQSVLRFSSWMPNHNGYNYNYWWYGASVTLDGTALYLANAAWRHFTPPPTPGYPEGGGNDSSDVQILRLDMPGLCSRKVFQDKSTENGGLFAAFLAADTLRIDLNRRSHAPPVIGVSCRVRNFSPQLRSDSVIITLRVPATVVPAPGGPPLRQVLAPLAAGDSVDVTWQLRPVVDSIIPMVSLPVSVAYATGGECPSGDGLDAEIPVVYTDIPDAEFLCDLFLSPALAVKSDTTRLAHDTMLVTLRIRNISSTAGQLRHAILRLLDGRGVRFLAPTDSLVIPPLLPGNSEITFQWLIELQSWPFGRPLHLAATLVDTFGMMVGECELRDGIPGSFGSSCALHVSTPVRVRADDSSFVPDPVVATAMIHNLSDTLRPYRDLRLDLSAARHLKPVAGESLRRPDFTIDEDSARGFTWLLRVSPPPNQTETETVRMIYRTNADTTERSCSAEVRIILLTSSITCAVDCPDTLAIDASTGRYAEDTVRVSVAVRNTGGLAQDIEQVRLAIEPADGARLLGPDSQAMAQLRPGKSDTVVWNMIVPLLPLPRSLRFTATVAAPGGRVLSSCVDALQVNALPVECALHAPDSVRYDAASGRFDPEEFEVVARLENRSDSSYTNLRALLDDGLLQRVQLAPGETAEQQRAVLSPGETWEARWQLVPRWGDRAFSQRLRVRFFFDPLLAPTLCEAVTEIGGAPRNAVLRCATAGHDSVWADSFYEAMIPDPLQVQFTVRNVGNVTSTACALAILPPPMLELAGGEDSVRVVPALAPGESCSAEWRLRILPDRVTAEPWIVRWQSDCEGIGDGSGCAHAITFVTGAPAGVVLTPWLLRFTAERDGPLPATQDVRFWTGGGASPTWQVTARPSWLDAMPVSGAGRTTVTVGPNSSALPVGVHTDMLSIDPSPLSSGDIQVIYEIRTKLGADQLSAASTLDIGSMYPNPVVAGRDVLLRFRSDAAANVRIELRDLLGRLRYRGTVTCGAREEAVIRIPTTDLPSGTYLLTARAAGHSDSRLLLVLP